jgi:hypothetical protein
MQPLKNPVRRNRNIGTAKQGHGQNNSLVIPNRADGLHWLDRIGQYSRVTRTIAGRRINFIVEETDKACIHPCTVSDVEHMLRQLPASDWPGLDTFLFRQPSRKQLVLAPVWGRLLYFAEITTSKGRKLCRGPVIVLDAIDPESRIDWSKSLDPDDLKELGRLKADGHSVERTNRRHEIRVTPQSARNTQLYRTLLHEIGHWFDWLSKVEEPASRGGRREALENRYFARPTAEREAFAHKYADAVRARLEEMNAIPFDPMP